MFTLLVMLVFIFAIMYGQVSDKFWRTETFRVEFYEGTGLDEFTGCYKLGEAQSSGLLEKKRKVRYNRGTMNFSRTVYFKLTPFSFFYFHSRFIQTLRIQHQR